MWSPRLLRFNQPIQQIHTTAAVRNRVDRSNFNVFSSFRHQKSPNYGLSMVAGAQSATNVYQSIRQQAREANLPALERRSWHYVKPKEKRRQLRVKHEEFQKRNEFRSLVGVAVEMMRR